MNSLTVLNQQYDVLSNENKLTLIIKTKFNIMSNVNHLFYVFFGINNNIINFFFYLECKSVHPACWCNSIILLINNPKLNNRVLLSHAI